jgi:hypothetical protein
MDSDASQPGTPVGGPLQALTHDRVNQRDSMGSVHDKISQFNSLSIAAQSRQLERKTADAALKRAMLGREEAEADLKKYKDELKVMRKAVDEGKERERRVGERLETIMVRFAQESRAKSWGWRLLTGRTGQLRSREGDTRTHASSLGEGDPTSAKGKLQDPVDHRQATGGAQVIEKRRQVPRGEPRTGEGAGAGARAGGIRG